MDRKFISLVISNRYIGYAVRLTCGVTTICSGVCYMSAWSKRYGQPTGDDLSLSMITASSETKNVADGAPRTPRDEGVDDGPTSILAPSPLISPGENSDFL